jgi:hypothetical protein
VVTSGLELLFAVVVAAVTAVPTGGASVAAVAWAAVVDSKKVQTDAVAFGEGVLDYLKRDPFDLDCGHLDAAACQADKESIARAKEQLQNVQQILGSLTDLVQFSTTLAVMDGPAITVADIPHIAMQRASLGTIDAGVANELFANAATRTDVAPDVVQLVSLVSSKLDMMAN